jgi:hypothetical protein
MSGSTNFLQHNPGEANQENDAAYAADSLRTGGIGVDATLPSPWLNKIWYQATTFVAAFAQMMANKGYTVNDNPIATLTTVLANVLTNADLKLPLISVIFSSTPTFDASVANGFDLVLSGNVTSSTLSGQQIGQILTFIIKQGAIAYTFVPPASINGWQPINPTPNSITVQAFIIREDGTIWPYTNTLQGYSSGSNSNGNWRITPDEVIEQWGSVATNVASGTRLTFPIAFTDPTTVSIQCLEYNALGGTTRTPAVSSWDGTGWTVAWSGGGTSPLTWMAIGK